MRLRLIYIALLCSLGLTVHAQTFVKPQPGETILPGSLYFVNWNGTDPLGDTLQLDLSTDGGATWTTIKSNFVGSMIEQWNVPNTMTSNAILRLIRKGPASTQTFIDLLHTDPNFRFQGYDAEFSNDGTKAVVTDDKGYVNLFDAATGNMLWSTLCGNLEPTIFISERAFAGKFTPDDSQIAVYTGTDSVIILNAANGAKIRSWHTSVPNWIGVAYDRDIEYSPDGSELAVTCSTVVKVYDPATGTEKRQFTNVFPASSMSYLRWTSDPTKMVTCGADATLGAVAKLFDATTGQVLQTFDGAVGRFNGLDISPDNALLLTCTGDSTLRVWDVATGVELYQDKATLINLSGCVFNSDGSEFGIFGNGYTLNVRNTATRQVTRTIANDLGASLDISPENSRYLISNYQGGRIYLNQQSQTIDTIYSGTFAIGTPTPDSVVNIHIGSAQAYAGDRVEIPVTITIGSSPLLDAITRIDFDLTFDASLLAPVGATPAGTLAAGERTLHFEIGRPSGVNAMQLTLEFVAALGRDSVTDLSVKNEQPVGYAAPLSKTDGMFKLLGVCAEGGPRFFNGDGTASLIVSRDQYTGVITVHADLIETGSTSIVITDAYGRAIEEVLNTDVHPGEYKFKVGYSRFSSGVYFAILRTPTIATIVPIPISR